MGRLRSFSGVMVFYKSAAVARKGYPEKSLNLLIGQYLLNNLYPVKMSTSHNEFINRYSVRVVNFDYNITLYVYISP